MKNRILGTGMAALMGAAMLVAPATAMADGHHRNRSHSEDGARANAIALGAAGIILLGNNQKTLGTIALGAAVLQAINMQDDIDHRDHRSWPYGRRDRDHDGWRRGHDRDDWDWGWNGDHRHDRDRDRDRDRDQDRDHHDRDHNHDRDHDHDGH